MKGGGGEGEGERRVIKCHLYACTYPPSHPRITFEMYKHPSYYLQVNGGLAPHLAHS